MVPSDCDDGHHGDGRMRVRPGGEAALSHGRAGDGVRGAIFRFYPLIFRGCGEPRVQGGRSVPLADRDAQRRVGWFRDHVGAPGDLGLPGAPIFCLRVTGFQAAERRSVAVSQPGATWPKTARCAASPPGNLEREAARSVGQRFERGRTA